MNYDRAGCAPCHIQEGLLIPATHIASPDPSAKPELAGHCGAAWFYACESCAHKQPVRVEIALYKQYIDAQEVLSALVAAEARTMYEQMRDEVQQQFATLERLHR